MSFASDGLLATLRKDRDGGQGDWQVSFDDGPEVLDRRSVRDPYETQAAAFLDAVEAARLELGAVARMPTRSGRIG